MYIPELNLAIEVQGKQHYTFTPYFHFNQDGFSSQLRRDREKRFICNRKGITLLEIASESETNDLVKKVISLIPKAETDIEFVERLKECNELHPERIISKKLRWKHGKYIKAEDYPIYRKKLLRLTETIRTQNRKILVIHKELLSFPDQKIASAKKRKLANLEQSMSEHVFSLKKFTRNWSKEIKMAFIIHKYK